MATKTLYLKNAAPSGAATSLSLQDGGTAPTGAITATGWIVATRGTTQTSAMLVGTKRAATTFSASDSIPTFDATACWRSENAFSGIFANTNWTLAFRFRSVTSASTQTGSIKLRIWKSSNASGAGAVELTSAVQNGSSAAAFSTTVSSTSTVTWSPGATLTFNNEYLWVQCEWNITTVGAAGNDVVVYVESAGAITTPDFTPIFGTMAVVEAAGGGSPAFGSAGTYLTYGSHTNSTLVAPAGIADGDLLIAFLFVGATGSSPAVTPPGGWSTLTGSPTSVSDSGSFNGKYWIFYKIAASEAGNYTFTHSTGSSCGVVARYTGVNTSTPFSPTPTTNTGTDNTVTATGFTTTANGSLVIFTEHDWGENPNDTLVPTGTTPTFTERVDTVLLYIADGTLATAGATGNKTHTCNNLPGSPNPWAAYLIGLNPVGSGDTAAFTGTVIANFGPLTTFEGKNPAPFADSTLFTADSTSLTADTNNPGDVAAFTGTVSGGAPSVTGTLAATDGTDTAAFTGSVRWLGTMAATESVADVAAFTGLVGRTGTLTAVEGVADVAAFTGTVRWNAVLAATEGADTAAFTGLTGVFGTLAATEGSDTALFEAPMPTVGTLAVTEGSDVAAFTGLAGAIGTLAAVEGADTPAFTGSTRWLGTLAVTEGADTTAWTGTVRWSAVLAATEARDTASFIGDVVAAGVKIGILAAVEGGALVKPGADSTTLKADSTLVTADSMSIGVETAHFTGAVTGYAGTLKAFEARDTASFTGMVAWTGVLAAHEAPDIAWFTDGVVGVLAAVEEKDTASFYGHIPAWDEKFGLRNETARRVSLQNRNGRVVYLTAEQDRITEL